jgi:hypothetical protein
MNLGIVERVAEMLDLRKEPRLFADDQVILLIGGEGKPEVARVIDRSAGGMRVTHKVYLDGGADIQVLTPVATARAHVAWTTEEAGVFISGLRLAND